MAFMCYACWECQLHAGTEYLLTTLLQAGVAINFAIVQEDQRNLRHSGNISETSVGFQVFSS